MPQNRYLPTPEQSIAMAEQLLAAGQKQQALNILLQSLQQHPGHPLLAMKLARLLHQHGQNPEAIQILKSAYAKGHTSLELSYLLAALLHLERQFTDAVGIIDNCISAFPDAAAAYNLKGSSLIELNRYEEAITAFEKAIALQPNSADAYNNLAWAFRALGRKDEAIRHFENAFSVNPQATEALSGLLLLKTFTEKTAEFTAVEKLLRSGSLSDKQAMELRFALGKAYEDIQDYPSAFQHFSHANQQWRSTYAYTIETDKLLFHNIKQAWQMRPRTAQAATRDAGKADRPSSNKPLLPIFIVGMPRSSTTLIEQILSSHSSVVGGGELPFLEQLLLNPDKTLNADNSPARLALQAKTYLEQAHAHIGEHRAEKSVYFTDKLPQNFRFIGAILQLFPEAKIIHCRREPLDTCLSLYKHHFPMAKHHYAYDLHELGQYYHLYEDLMQFWHEQAPGQILDVQYETLLDKFETEVRRLLAFCDLDFEPACLRFEKTKRVVRTASSDQVRQGLFTQGAGRWQNYEEQLAPLVASLQSYS